MTCGVVSFITNWVGMYIDATKDVWRMDFVPYSDMFFVENAVMDTSPHESCACGLPV